MFVTTSSMEILHSLAHFFIKTQEGTLKPKALIELLQHCQIIN